MIIAVANLKGSVGKTTTCLALGAALTARGESVHLWDLDERQRDLFDLATRCGLPVSAPEGLSLRPQIEAVAADWHIIECAPRADRALKDALSVADVALVPVLCEFLALRGLARVLSSIEAARASGNEALRARLLITMYSAPFRAVRDQLRGIDSAPACRAVIPRQSSIAEAPAHGQSILEFAPKSRGAAAYRALAGELLTWQPLAKV